MPNSSQSSTQVVLCGDNCMNVVLQVPGRLSRGKNFDLLRSVRRPGGNALVTSLALSAWDVPTAYLGVVGDDAYGRELTAWMKSVGLQTSGVVIRGPTRVSYAIIDEGDRTILDERNQERGSGLTPEDWGRIPFMEEEVRKADIVFLDRYCSHIHQLVLAILGDRRKKGERPMLVYRTGSRHSEGVEIESKVLPHASICLTKRAFLESLGLPGNPVDGCKSLSQQFGVPTVVATIGEVGAAYYDSPAGAGGVVPASPLHASLSTLGAGDFFRAGFLHAHLRGESIPDAAKQGNIVAALHCSRAETEEVRSMFFAVEDIEQAQ